MFIYQNGSDLSDPSLVGPMGNDGGSIPKRAELVKVKGKEATADKSDVR